MEIDPREQWERSTIEKLLLASVREQRLARRWTIFFRSIFWGSLLLAVLFVFFHQNLHLGEEDMMGSGQSHTAVVELKGVIESESPASAEVIIEGLNDAFEDTATKAVILSINSPGGSPVQAGQINDAIWKLRAKYPKIPIYAVVDEMCASGGYYVAAATTKIFVDKASLVGSIGVIMNSFGFNQILDKLGVERRVLIAGEHKNFLDPFSPMSDKQRRTAQTMLNQIHNQFIIAVRKGRGKRLHENADTFSGLVWTGEESIRLGLADGLGSVESVAEEVVKEASLKNFTHKEELIDRIAEQLGVLSHRIDWKVRSSSARLRWN